MPDFLEPAFNQQRLSGRFGPQVPLMPVTSTQLVSSLPWQKDRPAMIILYPLFMLEEQLGVMACIFNSHFDTLYERLVVEVSVAVKLSALMRHHLNIEQQLRGSLNDLEQSNDSLSMMSTTDELTGLLNRRGFMAQAEQLITQGVKNSARGMLCFADMDGLKLINDQYSHEDGDLAIRSMGTILKKTFRSGDVIARLGGDEFAIIIQEAQAWHELVFRKRLTQFLQEWNQVSGKPWRMGISLGAICFGGENTQDVTELLHQADAIMYEHKRRNKEGRTG
jgi:diguanylate cyclase (GGDEF)-like protein